MHRLQTGTWERDYKRSLIAYQASAWKQSYEHTLITYEGWNEGWLNFSSRRDRSELN